MVYKRCLFFGIFLIIFMNLVGAVEINYDDIVHHESLTIDLGISGNVSFNKASKLTASLFLFPSSDSQTVKFIEKTSNPSAMIRQDDDKIVYEWLSVDNAEFGLNSKVTTKVKKLGSEKVPFPPKITEYFEYTTPSEYIDSDNPDIRKKANEIVAGETDSIKAVTLIGKFVNSYIEYDKDYIPVIKKASWVYQNKRGVCDEYANLFIAMTRAIGIPARYISGVAYSNIYDGFGNHAWAEVYIPGHGWIPFDPTYGQYGWVDATHVALSKTKDTVSSITYSFSSNAEIDAKPLVIKAQVSQKDKKFEQGISMNIRLLKNNVKVRSYIPLEVEIKNTNNYYSPVSIYLTKSSGVYGSNSQEIILSPGEIKKIFFILDTKDNVQEGYAYEATVEVKTQYENKVETKLLFSGDYNEQISLNDALAIIDTLTKDEKEFLYDISLKCKSEKEEFYADEEMKLECSTKNNGNVPLESLKLCSEGVCLNFSLEIGEEKKDSFDIKNKNRDQIIKLTNDKISKSEYIGITILERPDPKIKVIAPLSMGYREGNITLTIESKSSCTKAVVEANNLRIDTESINMRRDFVLPFKGKDLLSEKLRVKLKCYDLRDKMYEDEKEFKLEVTGIPIYAKVAQFFIKIFS